MSRTRSNPNLSSIYFPSTTPSLKHKIIGASPIKSPGRIRSVSRATSFFKILQHELEHMWQLQKIPKDIREVYRSLALMLPQNKVAAIYSKEVDDLGKNSSLVQKILHDIDSREKIIENIVEMNEHLNGVPEWETYEEVRLECIELLEIYRMLTIVIIENIHRWKQSLMYSIRLNTLQTDSSVEFKWKGFPYFDKMKNDIKFVGLTEFSSIFTFSHLSDPFLLTPSRFVDKHGQLILDKDYLLAEGKCILPINPSLLKRIRAAEKILFGDQVYSGTYVNSQFLEELPSVIKKNKSSVFMKNKADKFELMIYLINNLIDSLVPEIVEEIAHELIYFDILEILVNLSVKDTIAECVLDHLVDTEIDTQIKKNTQDIIEEEVCVSMFEDFLFEESLNVVVYEYQNLRISQLIYEKMLSIAIKLEIESTLELLENSKKLSTTILSDFIEEIASEATNAVIYELKGQEKLSEETFSKFMDSYMEDLVKEAINEERKEESISFVLDKLMSEIVNEISEEAQLDEKIAELISSEYIDLLTDNLSIELSVKHIEDTEEAGDISKSILSSLINELISKETMREFGETRISHSIYQESLDRLIEQELLSNEKQSDLTILLSEILPKEVLPAEGAINEIRDGVNSPNSYSVGHSIHGENTQSDAMSFRSTLVDALEMDIDHIHEEQTPSFKPLKIAETMLIPTLEEYYTMLPGTIFQVCQPIPLLLQEAFQGVDPCWYWFTSNNKITGLLVYSFKNQEEMGKYINVHHFSALNTGNFQKLLGDSVDHLWRTTKTNYIRADLYARKNAEEIPGDIKNFYKQMKFKWKSVIPVSEFPGIFVHMGIEREHKVFNQDAHKVNIKAMNRIEYGNRQIVDKMIDRPMTLIGNRMCQINAIMETYGHENKGLIDIPEDDINRLQRDLNNIIEIISSSDSFMFPFMKYSDRSSVLEMKFNWISCTNIVSNGTKILKLKNPVYKTNLGYEVFLFNVDLPNIKVFFIKGKNLMKELQFEVKNLKTDLFYKTDDILRGADASNKKVEELWVPAFSKSIEWAIPWIRGMPLCIIGEEPFGFIRNCYESIEIKMDVPPINEGVLKNDTPIGKAIDSEFIFGVTEASVESMLELPLFSCLVEKTDFMKN